MFLDQREDIAAYIDTLAEAEKVLAKFRQSQTTQAAE